MLDIAEEINTAAKLSAWIDANCVEAELDVFGTVQEVCNRLLAWV